MKSLLPQSSIRVIGLMSGTSLDGIDLAACTFTEHEGHWMYTLHHATTLPYSAYWDKLLKELPSKSAQEVFAAHQALGKLYGDCIIDFVAETGFQPQLIASHGHTLFHAPAEGYTVQIGSGAAIAAITGIDTVSDFRSMDVALGGQGAPLVPVGDHFLFPEYDACINLGGIANISLVQGGKRVAWDICPVNMALNELAEREGLSFDVNGELARCGRLLNDVLNGMQELDFYTQNGAKSLGREWYEQAFRPLLGQGSAADLCRTVCEHIALQIAQSLKPLPADAKVLFTGGGAFNSFLMERIQERCAQQTTVPDAGLVNFKEALVFAFLGALNYYGRVNVFDSATGSVKCHIGGAFHYGNQDL
jgi:anhydro-N-acetylmuramic acid kinase